VSVVGDEGAHPVPGVLGLGRELLLLAVEEAVGCARVDHDRVLDPGGVEGCVERLRVLDRNPGIVAPLERQDGRCDLGRALERSGRAVPARSRTPVEADGAREAMI
jgi:hypothetical protein